MTFFLPFATFEKRGVSVLIASFIFALLPCYGQKPYKLKFSLDLGEVSSPKQVGVRGNLPPLSWEETYLLQDGNNEGIYEGEVTFDAGTNTKLEYKFVYGTKPVVWELTGENRILLLKENMLPVTEKWNENRPVNPSDLPILTAEELTADFAIVRQALEQLHPGLYRYKNPKEMAEVFKRFAAKFQEPMSYRQAFLELTRLTTEIECGHTFPNFFNQSGFIQQVVLNQPDKLPFTFRVFGERMLVSGNASDEETLVTGVEIQAINGEPVAGILENVASLVKADGGNISKKYADLNVFGVGPYEMFDAYFPLLFPPRNGTYQLKGRNLKTGQAVDLTVEAVSRKERLAQLKNRNAAIQSTADDLWKLEFWEDKKTAYLRLGTFDTFQLTLDWRKFLTDAFNQIRKRKIGNLVLDIRWNEGGQDDIVLFLAEKLANKPIQPVGREDRVRYDVVPTDLKPYLFSWNESMYDLQERVVPAEKGFYAWKSPEKIVVVPGRHVFAGQAYLLVNSANSSATFYLAELVKENEMATLLGETTGGSRKGLNGGQMFFLRLPNSGIELDIPLIGTFSNEKPNSGIVPNITVEETAEDFMDGRDPVIQKVKEIILSR